MTDETPKGVRAVGRALSTLTGAAIGNVPGAMLGAALSDVWIELVSKSWSEIRDARLGNAGRVLELTADELALGPEELVDLTHTTQQSTQVLFEVMEAAARTMDSNKIGALARALANGLRDDCAAIDREALVVRALSDIETVHVRVLSIVADQPDGRCTESHLVIREKIDRVVLGAVIETLKRHALLDSDDDFAGALQRVIEDSTVPLHDATWAVTPFGQLCLERLDPKLSAPALPEATSVGRSDD